MNPRIYQSYKNLQLWTPNPEKGVRWRAETRAFQYLTKKISTTPSPCLDKLALTIQPSQTLESTRKQPNTSPRRPSR